MWSRSEIKNKMEDILRSPSGMEELFRAGVTPEAARIEISERSKGLEFFGQHFISSAPKVSPSRSKSRSSIIDVDFSPERDSQILGQLMM